MADLFDEIERDVGTKLTEIGASIVSDLQDRLSIPVEYVGSRIIRSEPGESPRTETDRLRQSIESRTELDPLALIVDTDCPYAPPLEYGAPSRNLEPRPHFQPTFDTWADQVADAVVSAVENPST